MTDDNRWDDLLNAAIKKNKPKANEPVYDPGLLPPLHLNADRIPDSLDYFQLKTEMRNYAKSAADEIENLKTVNADLCSELYRQGNEIGSLREALNNLEPVPATPWYRDERNIALAAVLLVLVVMWLAGGR